MTLRGPNPSGLCMCGCGRPTRVATQYAPRWGHVKGHPVRYIRGHHSRSSPVDYIVDETTGCWVWQLQRDKDGYGRARREGRPVGAHRLFYERAMGPISVGLTLDHLCRNRACVNPKHLEPVTVAENTRRGLTAKLRDEQVDEIRRGGERNIDLARRFGVDPSLISHIRRGRKWVAA